MERWTIRRVLAWTQRDFAERGIDSARLDAELLVSEALGIDRVRLYMDLDRPLTDEERGVIRDLVKRRREREPVAYILGRREFFGRSFEVGPAVLVPRPETESLVELALERLPRDADARVLDLCTGSGAIGVTLAAERPSIRVEMTDLSAAALAVARRNAEAIGVADRVRFLEGDLFAPLEPGRRYDLIVCNPPYVPANDVPELMPEVRDHEPRQALVPGPTGLEILGRLAKDAGAFVAAGGVLLVEVGAGQAEAFERRLAEQPWAAETARHRDLAGIERVVEARARASS